MAGQIESTIELDDSKHAKAQSREWMAERAGWVIIAGVLLAALLGFLGQGPLGRSTTQSTDGGFAVEHYAVERYEAPAELRIRFSPPEDEDGPIRLIFSRTFADAITAESITPKPDVVEMRDEHIVYEFRAADLTRENMILFRHKWNSFGRLEYEVGVNGDQKVSITQYICP